MQVEEVLIIKQNDCYYGINTDEVEQILRVQDLTPMAMTPKTIRGLCSIEGSIVCALDFSNLLDGKKEAVDIQSFKARQVTINTQKSRFSLLVSEVINSVEVDQEKVEYVEDNNDVIVALLKHEDEIIQIISVERLIKDTKLPSYTSNDVRDVSNDNESSANKSYMQRYLFFMMGNENYALEVDSIREIISVPESFTAIAESNKEILGMISLRDDLLVVADLREYYDFTTNSDDKNRIIVARHRERHIGLLVDEIVDIQDVDISSIESLPENFKDKKIGGVLHLDNTLISIINTDIIKTLISEQSYLITDQEVSQKVDLDSDEEILEVVVFKMDDEEYAFNIDDVSEIIDMTEITPVANSAEHIKGVINIRGQVISIASLYDILKLKEDKQIDQQIIITKVNETRIGFVVDKVNDVRGIKNEEINTEEDRSKIFSNILQLEDGKRLVMMFDTNVLFSALELNTEEVA